MNGVIRLGRAVATAMVASLVSIAAHARDVDIRVGGSVEPDACRVSLSSDGRIDYGNVSATTLNALAATRLPVKPMTLSIACGAATRVGIATIDGRTGSVDADAAALIGVDTSYLFGVGEIDGKTIGAYRIPRAAAAPIADGQTATAIVSDNSGQSWQTSAATAARPGIRITAWAPVGAQSPGAWRTVVYPMQIEMAIAPRNALPNLGDTVPIDGLATFTIVYL